MVWVVESGLRCPARKTTYLRKTTNTKYTDVFLKYFQPHIHSVEQILASINKLKKQTSAMKSDMLRNKDLSNDVASASLQKIAAAEKAIGVMRVEFPTEVSLVSTAHTGSLASAEWAVHRYFGPLF